MGSGRTVYQLDNRERLSVSVRGAICCCNLALGVFGAEVNAAQFIGFIPSHIYMGEVINYFREASIQPVGLLNDSPSHDQRL